jgi:hypothetical protein
MAIELSPVAQSVLNADLRRFVDAGNLSRVTRIEQLLFWTPVPDEETLTATIWDAFGESWAPAPGAVPGSLTMCALQMLAFGSDVLSGSVGGSGIDGPLTAVSSLCSASMCSQMAAVHGDVVRADGSRGMSVAMAKFVLEDVVLPVFEAWSVFPFDTDADLQQHLDKAWTTLNDTVAEIVDPNVAGWIFEDPMVALMYNAMLPYIILCFVASFVPTWTNSTRREAVGFYDQRYAELIIYASVTDALRLMVDLFHGDADMQVSLQSLYESTLLALTARIDSIEGPVRVQGMYAKVAALSATASHKARHLAVSSGQFERRRDQAQNLRVNLRADQRDLLQRRVQFYLWVAAYVMVIAAAVTLIVRRQFGLFWAYSCTVLFLLVAITVVRMVAAARRDRNDPR